MKGHYRSTMKFDFNLITLEIKINNKNIYFLINYIKITENLTHFFISLFHIISTKLLQEMKN